MYVAAAEGLALLVFGVGRAQLQWPDAVHWGLIAVFGLLAFLLPGLFGDAILHTEIRKRIARALAATRTIPEACTLLERQAGAFGVCMVWSGSTCCCSPPPSPPM